MSAPLLTQASEVAGHVGQVVTLHGTIERSKIASLLGVDVASDSPDLRGQQGWATGTLERFEEPDPMEGGIVRAGRAAGSYLRLVDADGKLAQVSAGAPPAPAPCDR